MIEFDNKTIEILHNISRYGSLDGIGLQIYTNFELDDINERITYLLSNSLIKTAKSAPYSPTDRMFQLTLKGKIALENESKHRRNHGFNEFRAWITLLIAVIALVLSIVK